MQNLILLVTELSQTTADRADIDKEQIRMWANLYQSMLIDHRAATLDEVFAAAAEHIAGSRFFPTIAELAPLVERMVSERQEREARAAQQERVASVAALSGQVDPSTKATHELSPGYDFSKDPHWLRWTAHIAAVREGTEEPGPWTAFCLEIDRKRQANESVGFQGSSKAGSAVCPRCQGARWLSTGGYDPLNTVMGRDGSNYVACPTCCPGGTYSPAAEREALYKARR